MPQVIPAFDAANVFTAVNTFGAGVVVANAGGQSNTLTTDVDGVLRVSGHIVGNHPVRVITSSMTTTVTLGPTDLNTYHMYDPTGEVVVTLPPGPWNVGDFVVVFNTSIVLLTTLVVQLADGSRGANLAPGASVQFVWDGANVQRLEGVGTPSLAGCTGCTGCIGCTGCTGCTGCINCMDCTGCTTCTNCTGCTGCTSCIGCLSCTGCFTSSNCHGSTGCTDCANTRLLTPTTLPCEAWIAAVGSVIGASMSPLAMAQEVATGGPLGPLVSFNATTSAFTVVAAGTYEVTVACTSSSSTSTTAMAVTQVVQTHPQVPLPSTTAATGSCTALVQWLAGEVFTVRASNSEALTVASAGQHAFCLTLKRVAA